MYNCRQELQNLRDLGIELETKSFAPINPKPLKREMLADSFGQAIQPKKDGFLVEVKADTPLNFVIILKVKRGQNQNILPIIVSGREKHITPLGDQTKDESVATYLKVVPTNPTKKESWETTKYHRTNNVRLVYVLDNLFSMWEIAVATRVCDGKARHHLTIQKNYEGEMYNFQGMVIIPSWQFPGYDQWGDLQNLLERWPDPDLGHLTKIKSTKELPAGPSIPSLTTSDLPLFLPPDVRVARVVFFNLASGKGKTESGLTLHWSKIETDSRFAHLEKGQIITFYGTEKENDFTENLQAVGIEVVPAMLPLPKSKKSKSKKDTKGR